MKLSADTIIPPEKISRYLLRPLEESDKSGFLALAGYAPGLADRLLHDIRHQLLPLDVEVIGPFLYGVKYRIRGVLRGPNGRELKVNSIWATIKATGETRFLTLYPDTQ